MTRTFPLDDRSRWTTGKVILATLAVAGIGLGFYLVYRLRAVVFLVAVAVVLGTVIRPVVNRLQDRGVLRPIGVIAVYLLLALSVFGFMVLVVPLVIDQWSDLVRSLPEYYGSLRAAMLKSPSRILMSLALQLPADPALFPKPERTAEETLNQFARTYAILSLIMKTFLGVFAVLLIGFFWALEGYQVVRTLLRLVPPGRRAAVLGFLVDAERKLGGFIRGQGILSLTVGAAAFVAYSLIGLPNAFVLAIIAGLFELVPYFGPVLGAIPALLVSLGHDPAAAVWVLVATGIIQLVENVWLVPRIMNHSMGVNPMVTLLSLVTFTSVFGVAGGVLALPLAALVQLILDRLTASADAAGPEAAGPPPSGAFDLETIRHEIDLLRGELEEEPFLE
ncbi:MAG TPA: AI-2E family transporter [Anaerolineales bacterium]|nr:AI-2E family transporter [Anaerolineales bacterium]